MNDKTRVFNCDCLPAMRETPDKFYELAIVDPPYGIGNFVRSTSRGKKISRPLVTWNDLTPDDEYFSQLVRISTNQIIWGANYYNCFTDGGALVWYKNIGHPDYSQCEIASLSFKRTVDFVQIDWNVNRHSIEVIGHPCQKPIKLYKWLLKNYAKEGDKILDTHLGSQSSRIAAFDLGYDFTGYELDKDYFEAGCKRFEQHRSQLKLFPVK